MRAKNSTSQTARSSVFAITAITVSTASAPPASTPVEAQAGLADGGAVAALREDERVEDAGLERAHDARRRRRSVPARRRARSWRRTAPRRDRSGGSQRARPRLVRRAARARAPRAAGAARRRALPSAWTKPFSVTDSATSIAASAPLDAQRLLARLHARATSAAKSGHGRRALGGSRVGRHDASRAAAAAAAKRASAGSMASSNAPSSASSERAVASSARLARRAGRRSR